MKRMRPEIKLVLEEKRVLIIQMARKRLNIAGLRPSLLDEAVDQVRENIAFAIQKGQLDGGYCESRDKYISKIISNTMTDFVKHHKARNHFFKSGYEEDSGLLARPLDNLDSSIDEPEFEVLFEEIISAVQSSLFPACLANFSNEKIRERVQTLYVEVILEGRRQQDVAKDLGIGENTASEQLKQLIACMRHKLMEKNMLGTTQQVPASYERTISHLAQLANHEDPELASFMKHMKFLDALPYALHCRVNRLDLATVKQRYYRWKSKATLQAWFTFLDDIHLWADKQLEQNKRYLLAYMKYLFEHKNGSIESFESAQRRNLL